MTLTIKELSDKKCGHCGLTYGRHAKKGFMRCLYTSNFNLYQVIQEYNDTLDELNTLKGVDEKEEGEKIVEKVS